jgi:hypothetical protein
MMDRPKDILSSIYGVCVGDWTDREKEKQEKKQYNSHEVACIIADLFGDPCACNFNDIDTWLPYKCDFRETCCPNPVGVACWEQYLKHKEGR